jgi:hypothetical protein
LHRLKYGGASKFKELKMKSLLLVVLFLIAFSAQALITSSISGTSQANDGSTFKYHDKVSLMVKAGANLSKGQAVVYDLTADDGYTVVAASTVGQKVACIMEETVVSGKAGKCQVWGWSDAVLVDASVVATAGELGYASATAGYLKGLPLTSVQSYYAPVGRFIDSEAASGAVEFFISTF